MGNWPADVRRALHHLYDPVELRKSPLFHAFGLDAQANPIALRRILEDAIQSLKPAPGVSPHSDAWRCYHVLYHRFVEQFSQIDVAGSLSLSIRQLRRQESQALQALAATLAERYGLGYDILAAVPADETPAPSPGSTEAAGTGEPGDDGALDRERELQWVERSVPAEPVALADILQSALRTAEPLAAASGTQLAMGRLDDLPRLSVQVSAIRQAMLNLLAAAIRQVPQGAVRISAAVNGPRATVEISTTRAEGPAPAARMDDDSDVVTLARRLVTPSGGLLEVVHNPGSAPFTARFTLPIAEWRRVLAIDDNADALQLIQRFLHGSRYHFDGARDATQALSVAEHQRPDAIVLDVMLPGIDGWELLGRLREHPHTQGVPVVVCTILPQEELALALGAAAFLRKPVSRAALLQVLDQLWLAGTTPTAAETGATESR